MYQYFNLEDVETANTVRRVAPQAMPGGGLPLGLAERSTKPEGGEMHATVILSLFEGNVKDADIVNRGGQASWCRFTAVPLAERGT